MEEGNMYSIPLSRLFVYVIVLLVSLPSHVYAQSTVNLTLDDGSMDEEFLGTGGFTVTRDDGRYYGDPTTLKVPLLVWLTNPCPLIDPSQYSSPDCAYAYRLA
jgi:hypothetical protein